MRPEAFAAASTLLSVLALPAFGQTPTFGASTEAVRVDVVVSRAGRPVAGLSAADFELRDNGIVQEIEDVASGRDAPIQAILVLDTSSSVAGEKLEQLKGAGRALLDSLASGDCVALVAFSYRALLRTTPCSDAASARGAVESLEGQGSTALHDAVYASLSLADPRQGRSMLLVLSDGEDTASWLSPMEVLAAARSVDATIHGVGFPAPPEPVGLRPLPPLPAGPRRFLEDLADETGGRFWTAGGDAPLKETFLRVLEEVRSRYILRYQPRGVARAGWHRLDVRLTRGKAQIRARRGYAVGE